MVWLTRVCQVPWRFGRSPKDWQIDCPHTQNERSEWTNYHSISLLSLQEECMPRCHQKNWTKADDTHPNTVFVPAIAIQNKFPLSRKVSRNPGSMPKTCCCDRKAWATCAQSFTLWQQATIEFTWRDHSHVACLCYIYLVVLGAHSVCGEPCIQRIAHREVATIHMFCQPQESIRPGLCEKLWRVLREYGAAGCLLLDIKSLYSCSEVCVRVGS